MTDHALITDPRLQLRVRNRYQTEIASLQRLGFQVLCYSGESEGPFSAVLKLPMLLLMLPYREVITFPRPLRLGVATVLLRHPDPSTVALCMGKGVKLYSHFTDGTLLISCTFQSYAVPRPASRIIKLFPSESVDGAWAAHCDAVRKLEDHAGQLAPTATYDEYRLLSAREEDPSQYE